MIKNRQQNFLLNQQISFCSMVPKKDGSLRPVINLKALNQFIQPHHFKMEGVNAMKDQIRQNDWLAKVDLKDAYFAIPILPSHRKYLRFSIQQEIFQFNCLPFSLSSALWVFTKTLKPMTALLRIGSVPGGLHGRYTVTDRVQRITIEPGSRPGICAPMSGLYCQQQEIRTLLGSHKSCCLSTPELRTPLYKGHFSWWCPQ